MAISSRTPLVHSLSLYHHDAVCVSHVFFSLVFFYNQATFLLRSPPLFKEHKMAFWMYMYITGPLIIIMTVWSIYYESNHHFSFLLLARYVIFFRTLSWKKERKRAGSLERQESPHRSGNRLIILVFLLLCLVSIRGQIMVVDHIMNEH